MCATLQHLADPAMLHAAGRVLCDWPASPWFLLLKVSARKSRVVTLLPAYETAGLTCMQPTRISVRCKQPMLYDMQAAKTSNGGVNVRCWRIHCAFTVRLCIAAEASTPVVSLPYSAHLLQATMH
jgi:hypothetical protein